MKNQHDLDCAEKDGTGVDLRGSCHLLNVLKTLLMVMTALLFVAVVQAASPLTMTPEIEFIIGPVPDPAKNPWPWFDKNGNERGLLIGGAMSAEPARMVATYPYVSELRPFGTGTVSVTSGSPIVRGAGTISQRSMWLAR